MATANQKLGEQWEKAISDLVSCPRCNKHKHLTRLPVNFQCADVICKFCGFLAQVKSTGLTEGKSDLPDYVLGAAWKPQQEQIIAGIYHGLYVVCYDQKDKLVRIDFIPSHILQVTPQVFQPRIPLSDTARRAGWQGFIIRLSELPRIGIKQLYPAV